MSKNIKIEVFKTSHKFSPETGTDFESMIDHGSVYKSSYSGWTEEEILNDIRGHFGLDQGFKFETVADEQDRLDFSQLECSEGLKASPLEEKMWEDGEEDLYLADYSIYFSIEQPYQVVYRGDQ